MISRKLPTLVKDKLSWPASSYVIRLHNIHVCTFDFGLSSMRVGEVTKVGSKWNATLRLSFGGDRVVRRYMPGFHNLRTAMQVMAETLRVLVDEEFAHAYNDAYDEAEVMHAEIEAHAIRREILLAQRKADQEAHQVLTGSASQHGLVVSLPTLRALLGSNEELAGELSVLRNYLRNSCLLRLSDVREFAYRSRMVEHELIRRSEVERYANECEEFAQRGTGYGSCETQLDEHGNCPNAGNHRDSHTLRAL